MTSICLMRLSAQVSWLIFFTPLLFCTPLPFFVLFQSVRYSFNFFSVIFFHHSQYPLSLPFLILSSNHNLIFVPSFPRYSLPSFSLFFSPSFYLFPLSPFLSFSSFFSLFFSFLLSFLSSFLPASRRSFLPVYFLPFFSFFPIPVFVVCLPFCSTFKFHCNHRLLESVLGLYRRVEMQTGQKITKN